MTADEYEQPPPEEKEHFLQCRECEEWFDRRSLDEVLFHTDHKHRPDIQYSGSKSWIRALPAPNAWPQHVQCRMAYAWPFFTSSNS
jgi:hypothetical protein